MSAELKYLPSLEQVYHQKLLNLHDQFLALILEMKSFGTEAHFDAEDLDRILYSFADYLDAHNPNNY